MCLCVFGFAPFLCLEKFAIFSVFASVGHLFYLFIFAFAVPFFFTHLMLLYCRLCSYRIRFSNLFGRLRCISKLTFLSFIYIHTLIYVPPTTKSCFARCALNNFPKMSLLSFQLLRLFFQGFG